MPASTPYTKPTQVGRSKSDVSLMRDKNGCITCRVRQKKCSGIDPGQTDCGDCLRLNIQCLGVQHNRPDWLRNPKALQETKYRIKHHLAEHPVPRGRGPAPERPYLDFHDLIQKYSPRVPCVEEYPDLPLQSDRLYHMEPESPTHTIQFPGSYLTVQPGKYPHGTNTPSPSSSYAAMPRTPSSPDDNLFESTDTMCNFDNGMSPQELMLQVGSTYSEVPYVPIPFDQMAHSPQQSSPYRYPHSQSLFLTGPATNYANEYNTPSHIRPSARRQ